MTERTLKQLVGALAVVVGLWVVAELISGGGSGSIGATGRVASFFDGVDATSLERVRATRAGTELVLAREGGAWTVNGFAADSANVERFLGVLPELSIGDLAATNPANHDRMGVSADSAVTVELTVAGQSRTILVGDAGRRFGTAYVRLPDADEVYLLEGDLRSHVRRELDQWRDRTMVAIDTAAVVRIDVERAGAGYSLVRADSTWTFASGDSANATAVNGILSELARLVATGFVAEGDSLAALPLAATTRAWGDGERLLAEITLGEGEADRWARTSANDNLYRVSAFRAGRVAPATEDVRPGS